MSEEQKPAEEEFVSIGKSWEDLEAEMGSEEELAEAADDAPKLFFLSKKEIAEFAYDASFTFKLLVEHHQNAGEKISLFTDLPEEEKNEWAEIAGMALNMQGDPSDDNFARLVHAKTSMGLLKAGIAFDESFSEGTSPMVSPWECLPHERRLPLLIFKGVVRQLHRVWDRDNELLKR